VESHLSGRRPHADGRGGQRGARAPCPRVGRALRCRSPGGLMADTLGKGLEMLEAAIKRATGQIERLRAERDTLKTRLESYEAERAELRALKQEREEIVGQVEPVLRDVV